MQKLMYIYSQFGNGDIAQGKRILKQIAERLEHARNKHTQEEWSKGGILFSYNALHDEVYEVKNAIYYEEDYRTEEELLDVMAVAVRMLNCEYKK